MSCASNRQPWHIVLNLLERVGRGRRQRRAEKLQADADLRNRRSARRARLLPGPRGNEALTRCAVRSGAAEEPWIDRTRETGLGAGRSEGDQRDGQRRTSEARRFRALGPDESPRSRRERPEFKHIRVHVARLSILSPNPTLHGNEMTNGVATASAPAARGHSSRKSSGQQLITRSMESARGARARSPSPRRPLLGRVGVAVEGENAAGVQRAARKIVVDVLTPRVAVDLDRHGRPRGRLENAIPVRSHAGTHAVLASSRMPEDVHAGRAHRLQDPLRLVRGRPQRRVWGGHDELEATALSGRHVDGAVSENIRFDALDQPETPFAASLIRSI